MGTSFFCDNKDFLFAIWVFKTLGWSNRRIARLLLPSSTTHDTISRLVPRAYAYGRTFKSSSFAKDRKVRIRYVGDTNNLEYLEAHLHQNICGGGKRKKPVTYSNGGNE